MMQVVFFSILTQSLGCVGAQVFVVDNYFTGRKRNIEHWLGHQNFEMIHHDIVNPLLLEVGSIFTTDIVFLCDIVKGGRDISSCISGIAPALHVQPSEDNQDQHSRNCQHAGAGKEDQCYYFDCFNQRGVRRS